MSGIQKHLMRDFVLGGFSPEGLYPVAFYPGEFYPGGFSPRAKLLFNTREKHKRYRALNSSSICKHGS